MKKIDIKGKEGDAFALLGIAKTLCNKLDISDISDEVIDDMVSGDYDNFLDVFYKNFGNYVESNGG
jgi:hypothetical protein